MENDNLNIEKELDQMKRQYALLQEELNQQHIADEKLLFKAANNRLRAWQKEQIRSVIVLFTILVPSVIIVTIKRSMPLFGIIAGWGIVASIFYTFFSASARPTDVARPSGK